MGEGKLMIFVMICMMIVVSVSSFMVGMVFSQSIQEVIDNRPFRESQGDYQYSYKG